MFEFENALDEYMSHLRIERGASPRTAEAYRRDLEGYLAFLDSRDVDSPDRVTLEITTGYIHNYGDENASGLCAGFSAADGGRQRKRHPDDYLHEHAEGLPISQEN